MDHTYRVTKVTGVVALLFSLVACGGGGGSNGSDATSPSPSSAPPSAPVNGTSPTPTYSDAVLTTAFETINTERLKAGLGALTQSAALDTSAGYHSNYLLLNPTPSPDYGENEGNPGFIDVDPSKRMLDAGFAASGQNEVLTAGASVGTDAARALLASVYDRVYTMNQVWTQMGFGFSATAGGLGTLVADLGLPQGGTAQGMVGSASPYPVANATDVPVMMANEQPMNALPTPWGSNGYPGYPVSVQLPASALWTPGSFTLAETASSASVGGTVLTNSSNALGGFGIHNWAFFVPSTPLKPSTSYTATFTATIGAEAFSRTWSFTTRPATVTVSNVPTTAVPAATGTTVNVQSTSLLQSVSNVTLSSQCGSAQPLTIASPGAVRVSLTGGAVSTGCAATVTVNDLAYPSEGASFTVNFAP